MNTNDPQVTQSPAKPSPVKGVIKSLAYMLGFLLLVLIVGRFLLGYLDTSKLEAIKHFSESPWLILMRYAVYVGLWFGWIPLVRKYYPDIPTDMLRATKRPIVVVCVLYEVLFGINIFSYIV